METNAAAATVSVVEPVTDPDTAWMVTGPWATPLANPLLDIVAIPLFDELHVTMFVRFWVLLSVYVPVAANCCVLPIGTEAFAGVMAIETSVAAATVSVVDPLTDPEEA